MTPLRKVQMAPSCYSGLQENGADDGGVDERQGVFATGRPARFGGGSYHDPGCGGADGVTPPAGVSAGQGGPSAWRGEPGLMPVQTSLLQDAGFQPFVDHPSNDAVRDSLVEEVPQMAVVDRVEVT